MQVFNNNEQSAELYRRALALAISKDFAKQLCGKVVINHAQDSEQANRRRELLAIEEQAKQAKVIERYGKSHFKQQVASQYFAKLNQQANSDFDDKEKLFHGIVQIEDAAPAILDILAVRAASISRIVPLAKSLPWLADDLVSLVNKPQYRKRADVKVSDAKIALSYIGLDNLKMVMPTYMLKHWLPYNTPPFPLLKRKLWHDSLAVAMTTRTLAVQAGQDPFIAFTAGMLSNIGLMAITRCLLQRHQLLHNQQLKQAFDNRDKRLHDALQELEMSPELLLEQLYSRAAIISAELVEVMNFERLAITEALFDLAYGQEIKKMCPLAQHIIKAKAYVAMRSLAREELINSTEAKALLISGRVSTQDISLLKKTDIDHIKLKFN